MESRTALHDYEIEEEKDDDADKKDDDDDDDDDDEVMMMMMMMVLRICLHEEMNIIQIKSITQPPLLPYISQTNMCKVKIIKETYYITLPETNICP